MKDKHFEYINLKNQAENCGRLTFTHSGRVYKRRNLSTGKWKRDSKSKSGGKKRKK